MENLNAVQSGQKESASSHWARRIVFKQLSLLQSGRLKVVESGLDDREFGDGDNQYPVAEIHVSDASAWRDILTGGSIGAAESYVAGDWTTPDLTALLRFFTRNIDRMNAFEDRFSWITKPALRGLHWLNRNSKTGSRKNSSTGSAKNLILGRPTA